MAFTECNTLSHWGLDGTGEIIQGCVGVCQGILTFDGASVHKSVSVLLIGSSREKNGDGLYSRRKRQGHVGEGGKARDSLP